MAMASIHKHATASVLKAGAGLLALGYCDIAFAQAASSPLSQGTAAAVEQPSAVPVGAGAPKADTGGLGDIIVTARKQSESQMKVPVTIAAVNSDGLIRHQINDVTALVTQIPAIRFDQTYGGGGGTLTIRGIGSSTSDDGVDQTVATVFDGLQTSRGQFTSIGFLDLAQVEVLKGPQALFYGKNSPGGVLSLQSAGPTDKVEGYLRGGYATGIGEKKIEGAIGGPLFGDFRARLAVSYNNTNGWIKNVLTDQPNPFFGLPGELPTTGSASHDKNFDHQLAGRLTVDYKPSPDFTATLRLAGDRDRNAGVSASGELISCGGRTTPTILGVPDTQNDCALNYRTSVGPAHASVRGLDPGFPDSGKQPGQLDAYLASLTLQYSTGPVSITSVTGYLAYRVLNLHESANSFGYGANTVNDHWHQFSQELRLVTSYDSPINFAGGLYYDQSRTTERGPNLIFPLPADPRAPTAANPFYGSYFTYAYQGLTTSKSYSAFGQVRWKILDPVELDAGVRYSHDYRTGDVVNSFVNQNSIGAVPLEPEGEHVAGKRTYNNWSPEVTLNVTPIRNTIIFASYRVGYKPGESANPYIVSAGLSAAPGAAAPLFYDTETVKGVEIGFKSQLLDNKLRLTGAIFDYKYNHLQVSNFNSAAFVLTPLAGNLKTKGAEITATYRPVSSLTLSGALSYTRARWASFRDVACYAGAPISPAPAIPGAPVCVNDPTLGPVEDLTGFQKFRSPDWSGNAGFIYDFPEIISNINIELNANISFVSHYNSQENDSPFAEQKGYQLVDAGLTFNGPDNRLSFSIIGKNLTDKKYVGASYDQASDDGSATVFGIDGQPRTVYFQLGYKF